MTPTSCGGARIAATIAILPILLLQSLVVGPSDAQLSDTAPYFLIALYGRIDRVHLNGSFSDTVCTEPLSGIIAIDYHYRMQHVYWIVQSFFDSSQNQIRRARLNATAPQPFEVITFPLSDPIDLAVDWIEDKIYWTSGADSRIRVLNIAATEEGKRYIDIGFDGTTVFTKIIVDPINRTLYSVDTLSSTSRVIRGINYRGELIRSVSTGLEQNAIMTCPALSFQQDVIFWHNLASTEIESRGLSNASFTRSYSSSGPGFVVDISFFRGRIYWAQKFPMGLYYRRWETHDSEMVTVRTYSDNYNIKDFAIVDQSNQPLIADDIISDQYSDSDHKQDILQTDDTTHTTSTPEVVTPHSSLGPSSTTHRHLTSTETVISPKSTSVTSATNSVITTMPSTTPSTVGSTTSTQATIATHSPDEISEVATTEGQNDLPTETDYVSLGSTSTHEPTSTQTTSIIHTSQITSATHTPQITSATHTSQITSATHTPQITSATHTPQITSATHTPQITSATHTPQITSATHTPQITSATHTPQITSATHTPQITSTMITSATHTPQITSTTHTPQITSATHTPQITSTMHTSQLTSATHTPQPTSGNTSTHEPTSTKHTSQSTPTTNIEHSSLHFTTSNVKGMSISSSASISSSISPTSLVPSATVTTLTHSVVENEATESVENEEATESMIQHANATSGSLLSSTLSASSATVAAFITTSITSTTSLASSATAAAFITTSTTSSTSLAPSATISVLTQITTSVPESVRATESIPHSSTASESFPSSLPTQSQTPPVSTASLSTSVAVQPSQALHSDRSTPTSSNINVIIPSEDTHRKGENNTLEAIAITAACLGIAVLIFVGLAISDVIYYFSYERKHKNKPTSGLLGIMWHLVSLPFRCLSLPRYVFRMRRRSPACPYVPRCMDVTDLSLYNSPSEALSSSADQRTPTSTLGNEMSNVTVISNLSSDDSNIRYSSTPRYNAEENDIDDYRDSPLHSPEITQLELETKEALDVLELDSDIFF